MFKTAKRVLFIGETIIDTYHSGPSIGRSAKESVPCIAYQTSESWMGGVYATAAHARDFCKKVDVHTTVELEKERFIETPHNRKLLEVYGGTFTPHTRPLPDLSRYDVVVANDYGHGMFTPELIEQVCKGAPFLALNVQTNAGNYGFNSVDRWHRADYLVCNELEARLSTGKQHAPIIDVLRDLADDYASVAITRGIKGAMGMAHREIFTVPAFNHAPVDTMGAGDAFLAVTAVAAPYTTMPELLRIGNAAAAVKCGIVGHSGSVTKKALRAVLEEK